MGGALLHDFPLLLPIPAGEWDRKNDHEPDYVNINDEDQEYEALDGGRWRVAFEQMEIENMTGDICKLPNTAFEDFELQRFAELKNERM